MNYSFHKKAMAYPFEAKPKGPPPSRGSWRGSSPFGEMPFLKNRPFLPRLPVAHWVVLPTWLDPTCPPLLGEGFLSQEASLETALRRRDRARRSTAGLAGRGAVAGKATYFNRLLGWRDHAMIVNSFDGTLHYEAVEVRTPRKPAG